MVSKNQCKLLTETVVPSCWMRESWRWLRLSIPFNDLKLQFGGTWVCFKLGSVPEPVRAACAQHKKGRHRTAVTFILSAAVLGIIEPGSWDTKRNLLVPVGKRVWALWELHILRSILGNTSHLKWIQCINIKSIINSLTLVRPNSEGCNQVIISRTIWTKTGRVC